MTETEMKILRYVELHVVDKCNLNCKACSHLATHVKEDYDHFDSFKRDLFRLRELFDDVKTIRLLGGEPLLAPNVDAYMEYARKLFPNSHIELATNGLLFPRVEERIFDAIRENRIVVNITLYPPTYAAREAIASVLKAHKIYYVVSEPVHTFRRKFCPQGKQDAKKAFQECTVGYECTFLYEGKLSLCSSTVAAKYFTEYYGMDTKFGDYYLDIHDPDMTAEKIQLFLSKENGACSFCGKMSELPWGVCEAGKPISLKDWLSDDAVFDEVETGEQKGEV